MARLGGVLSKRDHEFESAFLQRRVCNPSVPLDERTLPTRARLFRAPAPRPEFVDFLKSLASDPRAPAEQLEAEFFVKDRPSSLLQRMIEPQEIANLVAYVASPLSSATNGAALRVDGGVTPTIV